MGAPCMGQSSGEDRQPPRQRGEFRTATGTASGTWCGCSCSHRRAATAREGGKDRRWNRSLEKGTPKLSPWQGMEGGGTAAGAVVRDQGGETSSTEGYREEDDPCGCRKGSHRFTPWRISMGSFSQLYATTFLYLKERKRESILLLELKLKLLNHLGSRSPRFHFSGTETCSSPHAFTQIPQQTTSSKGHRVQKATASKRQKPIPLPSPNAAPLPRPVNMGQGRDKREGTHPAGAPAVGEGDAHKPALHPDEPTCRDVGMEENSPERRRQIGFTCFLLCFPPSPSYLYCYM